uniref:Uncharacterized protein n=1 Tax=Aegilops tauschii subsp. strangulata TaxID=200361 RepID=A0A453F341_AEGTS
MYWDDKYGTHTVSSEVISSMRIMMTEDSNNAVSSSFLLDDDSSIPFSVDDISKSMTEIKFGSPFCWEINFILQCQGGRMPLVRMPSCYWKSSSSFYHLERFYKATSQSCCKLQRRS